MFDNTRIAIYDAMAGYITVNVGQWRYQYIVAYRDIANYHGIDSYPHTIANRGYAFTFPAILTADYCSFVDIEVLANYAFRMNIDIKRMANV